MIRPDELRGALLLLLLLAGASSWAYPREQQQVSPPAGASPEEIVRYERELARRIAAERRGAKQGDLLTPGLTAALQGRFRDIVAGEDGDGVLEAIQGTEPDVVEETVLAVNEIYPEGAVLTTMPPQILEAFPRLPDGVEYRFVGCRLILLARDSRVILDYTTACFW